MRLSQSSSSFAKKEMRSLVDRRSLEAIQFFIGEHSVALQSICPYMFDIIRDSITIYLSWIVEHARGWMSTYQRDIFNAFSMQLALMSHTAK